LRLSSDGRELALDGDEEDEVEDEDDGADDELSADGVVCGDWATASVKAPAAADANIHDAFFMICLCEIRVLRRVTGLTTSGMTGSACITVSIQRASQS
jgi:hypothetical protein